MIFDIVPDNFFSPLASPGKTVYWECIKRLFAITSRQLSFGVERDILVDDLEFYFEYEMAADMPDERGLQGTEHGKSQVGIRDIDSNKSQTEDLPADVPAGLSSRDKASQMLRRLENWGWIYTDVDYSYVQRVNFRDYAVQIIRTLKQVETARATEYQGYIYTIYNLSRAKSSPGLAITQIAENTDLLITGLKSLNANIKKYIDDLTKHSTVSEILDALLNDYYTNVVDKAYHRLMTSDNVSKFRPEIISNLEANSQSSRYMNAAAKELAEMMDISEEEAKDTARTIVHDVISAFRQMDDIIDQINTKNTRYQKAAVGRARFLLSSSDDVRGQLKNIICTLNDAFNEDGYTDYNMIYELAETDSLIRLFSWDYLDMDSLYMPRQGKSEFVPQEITPHTVSAVERQRRKAEFEAKLRNVLSAEKIEKYVMELLGERDALAASELPLDEGDTFIRLIYIRLYGNRKNMKYTVEPGRITEKDGFRFRDFVIHRRK
jgi:hypothetical protein